METTADVIVIGAGLAGLTAAATAARAGRRVIVADAHQLGGRARTDERRGFLFNQGAHALYLGGPAVRVLADLGLEIPPGGPPSTEVWGVLPAREGRSGHGAGDTISPLPTTPAAVVKSRLVDAVGKAQLGRFVLRLRSLDTSTLADISAADWINGLGLRPGAAEVVRTLAHVASYADDFDEISADAVAGQLKSAVADGVRYLDGGWQTLVSRLAEAARVAGADVRPSAPVIGVEAATDADPGSVVVRFGDGEVAHAGAVVLAVGGPAATASVLVEPPHWGLIGPPATAACLDLGLRRMPEKPVLFGVGEPLYFSTHTPSAALAPEGQFVAHAMRYGARDAATDRAELWAHARAAGVRDEDVVEQRFLARMVVNPAVPVPGSGLVGRPRVDSAGIPGLYLAGDWIGPEGLLADASLASGAEAGARAAADPGRAVDTLAGAGRS